jgi:transmembrane sensor
VKNEIEINDGLIARYLAGEASPEEAIALQDWLEDPVNKPHFTALQDIWHASFPGRSPRPINVEKAWEIVNHEKKRIPKNHSAPVLRKTFLRSAAVILMLVTFGILLFLSNRKEKPVEITVASKDSLRQITFADHSTAILNRNSTLHYPETFENSREVKFTEGEAFFNITPDAAKPFIIHTEQATIKVKGTAFNVIVKPSAFEVSVEVGKVFVYTNTDSVYLETGAAATLNTGAKSFDIHESNRNVWAYATHKYVFNNTPLHDVFGFIEKAQHCSIRVMNTAIRNCKLTATFEGVSTDYMLTLITEALNLSVTKNDDHTFTVEGEGCH